MPKRAEPSILIIDDEPKHSQYIRERFRSAGFSKESIKEASTFESARNILKLHNIHFIFCDLLVASTADRKTYGLDNDQSNAAKMPPGTIQTYIEESLEFIRTQSTRRNDEQTNPRIVVMTYFYDTPAIIQYREILRTLQIGLIPKFFDSPVEIRALGDDILKWIAETLLTEADGDKLLLRKLRSAYGALSLSMELHNITNELATKWKSVVDNNLLTAFWNLLKISLILVIDIDEPAENLIPYYGNWKRLYREILVNERIKRTLYLSIGSRLVHLSSFNILAQIDSRLMTATDLHREIGNLQATERTAPKRPLSQIEKGWISGLRSLQKDLEKNLYFQLLLLCIAHRTTPAIAIGGKPNVIDFEALGDSLDIEFLKTLPAAEFFEDRTHWGDCDRNTVMELREYLTEAASKAVRGKLKANKPLVEGVVENLISSVYGEGGYYFNGGFVIKTLKDFKDEQESVERPSRGRRKGSQKPSTMTTDIFVAHRK